MGEWLFVPEQLCDRSLARSAWPFGPRQAGSLSYIAPSRHRGRHVVIRAVLRTDSIWSLAFL
jgi:hypothetical protein